VYWQNAARYLFLYLESSDDDNDDVLKCLFLSIVFSYACELKYMYARMCTGTAAAAVENGRAHAKCQCEQGTTCTMYEHMRTS